MKPRAPFDPLAMKMLRRDWLLMLAGAVGGALEGCAHGSETARFLVPNFESRELDGKNLLYAPYPRRLGNDGYLPLLVKVRRALSQRHAESEAAVAALKELSRAGAQAARRELETAGIALGVLQIEPARWRDYWDQAGRFSDVSLDGVEHYRVPQRESLRGFVRDADYALVFTQLGFSRFSSTTHFYSKSDKPPKTSSSRQVFCETSFLVWDYAASRPLAQGRVSVAIDAGDVLEIDDLQQLGALVGTDVFDKPPFGWG